MIKDCIDQNQGLFVKSSWAAAKIVANPNHNTIPEKCLLVFKMCLKFLFVFVSSPRISS